MNIYKTYVLKLLLFSAVAWIGACTDKGSNLDAPLPILDSGSIMIYTNNNSVYPINVSLNNKPAGTLTTALNGTPSCGSPGSITLRLPAGNYLYQGLLAGDKLWQGNALIKKDSCTVIFLNRNGDSNLIDATPVDSTFSFRINNAPVSFRYPWRGRLIIDGYQVGGNGTSCVPLFQTDFKLGLKAYNHYREPLPLIVPGGFCSTSPAGNIDTYFEFNCKMNNRPVAGQQYSSCTGQMRFKISFGSESPYHGLYGIETTGDYLNLTITNVTGLTVSGTFEGRLTQYKMINCQKVILGRSVFSNGIFRFKYRYN